jgi:uncharacterized protein involved in exopolysaccharide biosynthesis
MTFKEVQNIFEEKFGINHLADIARELSVTPQVVSNWKSRNQVPYKYVKKLRELISNLENTALESDNIDSRNMVYDFNVNKKKSIEDDDVDIMGILFFIAKRIKRKIVLFLFIPSLFCSIQIINVFYVIEPTYISLAKILPENGKSSSIGVGGLASQFGINIRSQGKGSSSLSDLYPEILKSRTLSRRLLKRKFDTKKFGESQSLLKILTYGNSPPPKKLDALESITINKLTNNMIVVEPSLNSPLINIYTKTFEASFSAQLASAVIDELGKIEKQYLTGKATEKRIFIHSRIKDAEISLKNAEEKLRIFREKNRNIIKSPALQLEVSRLMREQEVQTQIYLTLKKEFELVQIEEIEKGSMVMVLDPPEPALGKSSPNKPRILIITGIMSLIFSGCVIMFKDLYKYIKDEFIIQ